MLINNMFMMLPKLPNKKHAKILLLTHSDLDGEGAYFMLKAVPMDYDIEVRRLSNAIMSFEIGRVFIENESAVYDFIIACDISCSKKVCDIINRHAGKRKFVMLDHHATANYINEYSFGICYGDYVQDSAVNVYHQEILSRDINTPTSHSSGTSLIFDYINTYCNMYADCDAAVRKELTHMAFLIRSYDTWDWYALYGGLKEADELDVLFNAYGDVNFTDKFYDKIVNRKEGIELDDVDRFILTCERQKAQDYVNNVKHTFRTATLSIDGSDYTVLYVCANKYTQEVLEYMRNHYADIDIHMINYGTGISLRTSKDDIHLSDIALRYNGGGHDSAAGVRIPTVKHDAFITDTVFDGEMVFNVDD